MYTYVQFFCGKHCLIISATHHDSPVSETIMVCLVITYNIDDIYAFDGPIYLKLISSKICFGKSINSGLVSMIYTSCVSTLVYTFLFECIVRLVCTSISEASINVIYWQQFLHLLWESGDKLHSQCTVREGIEVTPGTSRR